MLANTNQLVLEYNAKDSVKIYRNKSGQLEIETIGDTDVIVDGKIVLKKFDIDNLIEDMRTLKICFNENTHNRIFNVLKNLKYYNMKTKNNETLIQWSTYIGLTEISNFLIDKGCNIHEQDCVGNTPLHYSTFDVQLFERLVSLGANINTLNKSGESVVFYAVKQPNIELVKRLIELGANIHLKNNFGNNILHYACNDFKLSELLLDHGVEWCDANKHYDILKSYPLERVIEAGNLKNIEYYMRFRIEQVTTRHILLAHTKNRNDIVELLLQK